MMNAVQFFNTLIISGKKHAVVNLHFLHFLYYDAAVHDIKIYFLYSSQFLELFSTLFEHGHAGHAINLESFSIF